MADVEMAGLIKTRVRDPGAAPDQQADCRDEDAVEARSTREGEMETKNKWRFVVKAFQHLPTLTLQAEARAHGVRSYCCSPRTVSGDSSDEGS